MILAPGEETDAAELSAVAVRSKGFWGYQADLMEAFRDELTLAPGEAATATVARDEPDGPIIGFYRLTQNRQGHADAGELAMLFVVPEAIGSGVGRALLAHAVSQAGQRRWTRLRIDSDPGAEGFYVAHGARRVGTVPSGSVAGRELPLLELPVPAPPSEQ